jgi:hypothetical protein
MSSATTSPTPYAPINALLQLLSLFGNGGRMRTPVVTVVAGGGGRR